MAAEPRLGGCLTPREAHAFVGRVFPGPRSRRGPRHLKVGRRTRYWIADLQRYIQETPITDAPRTLPNRQFPRVLPDSLLPELLAAVLAVEVDDLIALCSAHVGPMWVGIGARPLEFVPYFRAVDVLDFIGAPVAHRVMDA